jgi:hypothetical protein
MSLSRFFAAAFGFEWLPEKHQAYYVSETINRLDVQVSYTRYERGWAAGQELGLVKLGTIALDGTQG